jgi:hypothetical protein
MDHQRKGIYKTHNNQIQANTHNQAMYMIYLCLTVIR